LELLQGANASARRASAWERLRKATLDYDNSTLSAPQRHFLLRQLHRLHPEAETGALLAAEDLADQYVSAGPIQFGESGLRATSTPGVWQFASAHGCVLLLHRTEGLLARVRTGTVAQLLPPDLNLTLLPPGEEAAGFFPSLPASPLLPGWRLTLALKDQRLFDTAAEHRVAAYVWTGALVVAAVVVLASMALGLVRRQTALTQLRNDLVANVTHELKTPLASMRLLVDTLLGSESLHPPAVRDYLQLIAQENLRLSRLIDNFLAFSRMERNRYKFDFQPVPAAEIVEAAAVAVRKRFREAGCRFEIHPAAQLPSVMADSAALVTVLVNLLDNAFKYSGDGKQITLAAEAADGRVCFTVADNGIGLSPRDSRRIFKRFYRVPGVDQAGGGCGLGLSIVDFIVRAHRGSVSVQSRLGRGSTFTVEIPAAASVATETAPNI
jgi:signal transduction histidine kinase